MPPGIGNVGLGTAIGTIQINTNQLRSAAALTRSFGLQMSGAYSQASQAINSHMQVMQAQTGLMRGQLGVLTANISATKQQNAAQMQTAISGVQAQQSYNGILKAQLGIINANIAATRAANKQAGVPVNTGLGNQINQAIGLRQNIAANQLNIAQIGQTNQAQKAANTTAIQGQLTQAQATRQNIAQQNLATAQIRNQVAQNNLNNQQIQQQVQNYQQLAISLAVVGAASAKIINIGVSTAGYFEQQSIAFAGLTGSIKGGIDLMEKLRSTALKMKVPFQELVQAVRSILPSLEGDTSQLDKWLDITRRVATLNPVQGISGAGFSVNELLTGGGTDLKSLAGRFNLNRNIYFDEFKKNSDIPNLNSKILESLNQTLDRMGVTTQVADAMGKSFVNSFDTAKDAANQLLADGFTPLIQLATPKINAFTTWVTTLRQSQKEAIGVGAAIISIVGLGIPVGFFLVKWVSAFSTLATLSKQIGTNFLLIGAAVAGGEIGKFLGNKVQESRGEKPSDWKDIFETAKKLLFNGIYYLVMGMNKVISSLYNMSGAINNTAATLMRWYASLLDTIGQSGKAADARGSALGFDNAAQLSYNKGSIVNEEDFQKSFGKFLYDSMFSKNNSSSDSAQPEDFGRTKQANGYTPNQSEIIDKYFEQLDDLTTKHGEELVDAENSYGQQRAETVTNHDKEMVREEEDFGIQRLRAEQDYQQNIADLVRNSARQVQEWNQDLADSIAKETADSNKKLIEIDEQYNKDKEKAEKEHNLTLLEAASNLDARAVWQENKRYNLSKQEAETAHKDQVDKEKSNLADKIANDVAENAKRIAKQAENDRLRLADMAVEFDKHKALEDQDRALKLARQQQDYQQQLASMDAAESEKIAKMNEQFAKEKVRLESDMRDKLKAEQLFGGDWLKAQNLWQDEALRRFKLFFKDLADAANPTKPYTGDFNGNLPSADGKFFKGFATGGEITKTGLAFVHKGEQVLNRSQQGKSVSISEGAIQIHASPGMDEPYLARLVRDQFIDLLGSTI